MNAVATRHICCDCHAPATVHYCLGATRCEKCSEAFGAKNRAEEAARIAAQRCDECGEHYSGYGCEECCDHEPDPDEGMHCLGCGKDCSEGA